MRAPKLLFLCSFTLLIGACGGSTVDPGLDVSDSSETFDASDADDSGPGQTEIGFTCKEGETRPCGGGLGACVPGAETCAGGAWGSCFGEGVATAETCNDLDDDCDGETDEDASDCMPYYADRDGDGFAGMDDARCLCEADAAAGYVFEKASDCDDSEAAGAAVHPEAGELCNGIDDDCDGRLDGEDEEDLLFFDLQSCERDQGACAGATKEAAKCVGGVWEACDDASYAANSEAYEGTIAEASCDGLDNDCDGSTDEESAGSGDACGSDEGACSKGVMTCALGEMICSGAALGTTEVCDGVDNDCDALTDEDFPGMTDACGSDVGECANGELACKAGVIVCEGAVIARPEQCDDLDNDCDGSTDEGGVCELCEAGTSLACGTKVGECEEGTSTCVAGSWGPCEGFTGSTEELCDGLDNDCDDSTDESFPGKGTPCGEDVGACSAGVLSCDSTTGIITCEGAEWPSVELCDGVDNDCDGATDEGSTCDECEELESRTCGSPVGACEVGVQACVDGHWGICEGALWPNSESCNGIDDDCDGDVDEEFPDQNAPCGLDLGICSLGKLNCVDGELACQGGVDPTDEVCDGLDNDCDGDIDESFPGMTEPCGTDEGECVSGLLTCAGGDVFCNGEVSPTTELCNGVDDDCDGDTDETFPGIGGDCGTGVGVCQSGALACLEAEITCIDGVEASPETCDGLDNDCDAETDEGGICDACESGSARACGEDEGSCEAGTQDCVAGAWTGCEGGTAAVQETCNGLDDDCDGETDESFPGAGEICGLDEGMCVSGAIACVAGELVCKDEVGPKGETCNSGDDDCDGTTDEDGVCDECTNGDTRVCGTNEGACIAGSETCVGGHWRPCAGATYPVEETCDGEDNDCDGDTDETYPGQDDVCGYSDGLCTTGNLACVGGDLVCYGEIPPGIEVCDGDDNDCDGDTDEAGVCDVCVDGETTPCGDDTGACEAGTELCVDGQWSACDGFVGPSPEICDGLDNDCDDMTDEEFPGLGDLCGDDEGACSQGLLACVAKEVICDGEVLPADEHCDELDNDCDGATDEGDVCGECSAGAERPCGDDEGACEAGTQSCVDGYWSSCEGQVLPSLERCDELDNDCDGATDEEIPGVGDTCGSDLGACESGTWACSASEMLCDGEVIAVDEACDGMDNDCDGQTDEGFVDSDGDLVMDCVDGDDDGDGDPDGDDCAPLDEAVHHGATETCNGIDDDCDAATDEGFLVGDDCGVGACSGGVFLCSADGTSARCDTMPGGPSDMSSDEVCDSQDNDCDGTSDEGFDLDLDCGQGACAGGSTECSADGTTTRCSTMPGGSADASSDERCSGVDDDCDGQSDEGFELGLSCGTGACAGGATECTPDGSGTICDTMPGGSADASTAERCDGLDDDCDDETDEGFDLGDSCGTGACAGGELECSADGSASVCSTMPGGSADQSSKDLCNGEDDDCDGQTDDAFVLGESCGTGACTGGVVECDTAGTGTRCDTMPGGSKDMSGDEACNGADDDCDESIDEDFSLGGDCGLGVCLGGVMECLGDGSGTVCSTMPQGSQDKSSDERCNGLDDDCDESIDEDFALGGSCGVGACVDGTMECLADGSGTTCSSMPGGSEDKSGDESCNGLDDDCDDSVDEDFALDVSCGSGQCAGGLTECSVDGSTTVCSTMPGGSNNQSSGEICNGIDDDCDEGIDEGGDDWCALEESLGWVCAEGRCRQSCTNDASCQWTPWDVDCEGQWDCVEAVCVESCGGSCGDGSCEPPEGEDAWSCPSDCTLCDENSDCSGSHYCAFARGACGAPGVCRRVPQGPCDGSVEPICGCDGVTYSNNCERRKAGVSYAYAGACVEVCTDDAGCLGSDWEVACFGHWDCVAGGCFPICGDPCGDGDCEASEGEDAASCAIDCGTAEATAYRLDSLAFVYPALCMPVVGMCDFWTDMVNDAVQEQIDDGDAPLDLLGVFTPLNFFWPEPAFTLSEGTCLRDAAGQILSCGPDPTGSANPFDDLGYDATGACFGDGAISAPCFLATTTDARFRLFGLLFGLLNPSVAGQFDGSPGSFGAPVPEHIIDGRIYGFIPRALAATIGFNSLFGVVTLEQLLDHESPDVYQGLEGWWLTLSFDASLVSYEP